jgi:predicted  nucleic acid-binding Zn-ribbon protein
VDPRSVAGSQEQPSDGRVRSSFAPRIVEQVRELHATVVELSQQVGGFASRQGRRELKEARQSESDMLRVLGFESYEEFQRVVGEVGVVSPEERDDVVVLDEALLDEALPEESPTVATLEVQRVVQDMTKGRRSTDNPSRASARADELDGFRGRVGAFEEELAEVRFELTRMREELVGMRERLASVDVRDAVAPAPAPAARTVDDTAAERLATRLESTFADLAQSLASTAAELTALFGQLHRERTELSGIAQRAREEADRLLRDALDDAQRARDAATADARQIVAEAQAQAGALTRDAMVTFEGLRRLHEADEADAAGDAPA